MLGWNSVVRGKGEYSNFNLTLRPSAARFEGGSANMSGMIGFGASVQTLLDAGCHDWHSGFGAAILGVAEYAVKRLRSIGAEVHRDYKPENHSGIVSFTYPQSDSATVRRRCISQNVILSVRNNRLRIAIHGYNTTGDVDRLIDAIQMT
jgi:selenocysteine lyase/cysteine desulfurase